MKKIAIFGGSFNPIHNSHVNIVKNLIDSKIVDEVWILPCRKHVFNKTLAKEKDRVKMIKLALENIKNVKICNIELKSKEKSYTIKTLRRIKRKFGKKYKFFIIIGSDIIYEVKKWYKYQELFNEVEFIVFKRKGYLIKKVNGMKIYHIINKKESGLSSTEIRKRAMQGKSFKALVPVKVSKYILEKKLYL
ncbi:MAG: nicotinate (nicotinamide) nucleotide adenylyltransferase [Nanoarchaeota archaeon]|nr:nicotinate (nicotinamide) nucleotide adenylyltransferase [Nanoarchaeota archaeon]